MSRPTHIQLLRVYERLTLRATRLSITLVLQVLDVFRHGVHFGSNLVTQVTLLLDLTSHSAQVSSNLYELVAQVALSARLKIAFQALQLLIHACKLALDFDAKILV